MGKEKKIKRDPELETSGPNESDFNVSAAEDKTLSYEEKLRFVSIIAKPMASRKLAKKLYKLVKKASKHKTFLRHGLKDVQAQIRKGERGLVVFAGNVTPVEVMCHMPAVCEEKSIPYIYTPSREDLGIAMGVKRTCLMVLVKKHEDYEDLYQDCASALEAIPIPVFQSRAED